MYGFGFYDSGFTAALMLVAFIASIVLTVIGYKRFVGTSGVLRVDPRDQRTWGPFLCFDTLIIDKVLKVLYLFCAILVALVGVALVISALFRGFGEFVAALIFCAIGVAVIELLVRLSFELTMMVIAIARNTSEIKRAMVGGEVADADGISNPSPEPSYAPQPAAAAAPPAPAPIAEPVSAPPAPAPDAAPAPEAAPATCPQCGTPVVGDGKFCTVCGRKLD